MIGKLGWATALMLALSACAGDEQPVQEPVSGDGAATIPDAPGGETSEKPAGAGQAAAAAPAATPTETASTPAAAGEKSVVPGALNVRQEPSMESPVVRVLQQGAKVSVQSCDKGWCKIGEGEFVGARHLQ